MFGRGRPVVSPPPPTVPGWQWSQTLSVTAAPLLSSSSPLVAMASLLMLLMLLMMFYLCHWRPAKSAQQVATVRAVHTTDVMVVADGAAEAPVCPSLSKDVRTFSEAQRRSGRPGVEGACPEAMHTLGWERLRAFEARLAAQAGWKLTGTYATPDGGLVRITSRSRADSTADEFCTRASFGGVRAAQVMEQWATFDQRVCWDRGLLHPAYLKRYARAADGLEVEIVCYCSTPAAAGLIASRGLVDIRTCVHRPSSQSDCVDIVSSTGWAPDEASCKGLQELKEWQKLAVKGGLILGRNMIGCGFRLHERLVGDVRAVDMDLITCTELFGNIGRIPPSILNGAIAGVMKDMMVRLSNRLKLVHNGSGAIVDQKGL